MTVSSSRAGPRGFPRDPSLRRSPTTTPRWRASPGRTATSSLRLADPQPRASATAARSAPPGLRTGRSTATHLCMVRLELLRLNTAPALDPARLADVAALGSLSLRGAARARPPARADAPPPRRARLPRRLVGRGATTAAAETIRAADPERVRRLSDVARHHQRGLLRRAEGRARPRHATTSTTPRASATPPPPSAMKETLGYGATTCSLSRLARRAT